MKKNTIILLILAIVYILSFVFLFIRMRTMSSSVLEELSQNNIYYLIGFTFVVGLTALFFPLISLSNTSETITESIQNIVQNNENTTENTSNLNSSEDTLKSDFKRIIAKGEDTKKTQDNLLWELCNRFEISQALWFKPSSDNSIYSLVSSFAYVSTSEEPLTITDEYGLTGQAIFNKSPFYIKEIPEGYIKVVSGLGESLPKSLLIIPCVSDENSVASVFELASLKEYSNEEFNSIVSICTFITKL